jgi:hypothetical protein
MNGGKEEMYTWKKVTSSVIGIITGNPVVDNYGPMEIRNHTTGEVCQLEFKARGWKASSAYQVVGKVLDAGLSEVDGTTRSMHASLPASKTLRSRKVAARVNTTRTRLSLFGKHMRALRAYPSI